MAVLDGTVLNMTCVFINLKTNFHINVIRQNKHDGNTFSTKCMFLPMKYSRFYRIMRKVVFVSGRQVPLKNDKITT